MRTCTRTKTAFAGSLIVFRGKSGVNAATSNEAITPAENQFRIAAPHPYAVPFPVIPSLRSDFNARFRPEAYRDLRHSLDAIARTTVAFPVAETPCFFPQPLLDEMARIGADLTRRLANDPAYLVRSRAAIPDRWRCADENTHPHFLTADFGLVRSADGSLAPRLVEMQAFPSVFGFQFAASEEYRAAFGLDPSLRYLFGGLDESAYWKLLDRTIVAGHDPETVVLVDVDPLHQKTLPDFNITADRLGIPVVRHCRSRTHRSRGKFRQGSCGASATATDHTSFPSAASTTGPLSTSWFANRSRSSSITASPSTLNGPATPTGIFTSANSLFPSSTTRQFRQPSFLDQVYRDAALRERFESNRDGWILKPLFSFAGQGIRFAPADDDLAAIPRADRSQLAPPGASHLRTRDRDPFRTYAGRNSHPLRVARSGFPDPPYVPGAARPWSHDGCRP